MHAISIHDVASDTVRRRPLLAARPSPLPARPATCHGGPEPAHSAVSQKPCFGLAVQVHQFAPTYRDYVLYSDSHVDGGEDGDATASPKAVKTFRAKTFVPVEEVCFPCLAPPALPPPLFPPSIRAGSNTLLLDLTALGPLRCTRLQHSKRTTFSRIVLAPTVRIGRGKYHAVPLQATCKGAFHIPYSNVAIAVFVWLAVT